MMRAWFAAVVVLAGCPARQVVQGPRVDGPGVAAVAGEAKAEEESAGPKFALVLADGRARVEAVPVAEARRLDAAEEAAVLARVPRLKEEAGDVQAAALRAGPRPPAGGQRVAAAFEQVKASAPAVAAGPVKVVRHSPDGEVAAAESVTISFSQAMTTLGAGPAADGVATLRPAVAGRWSWLGTQTLVFRAEAPLAKATNYSVTLAPGLTAAGGGKLAEGTGPFAFATPPPRLLQQLLPRGLAGARPLLVVAFDQRIDAAAVFAKIGLTVAGKAVAIERVAEADARRDKETQLRIEAAGAGRWLVVRPKEPVPPGQDVVLTVAAGTHSAEGPRRTKTVQRAELRSPDALTLTRSRCGYDCAPESFAFVLEFSNALAEESVAKAVRVTPALPEMDVRAFYRYVEVRGVARADAEYTVTVDGSLVDRYGQTLARPVSAKFKVGPARPWVGIRNVFAILDPAAGGRFTVPTFGLRSFEVRVRAVTADDWEAFVAAREGSKALPGRQVAARTVTIADPNVWTDSQVDLGPALRDGVGHAIVEVTGAGATWVQATRIGLDAYVDHTQMKVYASALATGAPLADVQLQLTESGSAARTDAQGLARLELKERSSPVLVARRGDDVALLPRDPWWRPSRRRPERPGWRAEKVEDLLRWYVFDDRRMYRPGETVRVKGWLRRESGEPRGGLELPGAAARQVRWRLVDGQEEEVASGVRRLGAHGGFDLEIPLGTEVHLGEATLELAVAQGTLAGDEEAAYTHVLQIQEFRRPEFEVDARAVNAAVVQGEAIGVVAAARYFAGGPLAAATTEWSVHASAAEFEPPGRGEYVFGAETWRWLPRRLWRREASVGTYATWTGRTDAGGEHHLDVALRDAPGVPISLEAEATVTDVNQQEWTAETTVLVHPASVYVGLRPARWFVGRGEPLVVEALAVGLGGEAVAGRKISVRAERLVWERVDGAMRERRVDPQACAVTSGTAAVRCELKGGEPGLYEVAATVSDERGRTQRSAVMVRVTGGPAWAREDDEIGELTLVADRDEYAPGDTAKVWVHAPFAGEGVVTLRRGGIVETRRISVPAQGTTLEVPIAAAYVPQVAVDVAVVGAAARADSSLPPRPAYVMDQVALAVPARALELSLEPGARELAPGGRTDLAVRVRDAEGRPVAGGEVAVVVVDEVVLALAGISADDEALADPAETFFVGREDAVEEFHSRDDVARFEPAASVLQPREAVAGEKRRAYAGSDGPGEEPEAELRVRTRFDALALFAAALPTDAQGRARVQVRLPDSVTRYRVYAAAVAGADRFGRAETTISTSLPLTVRPSPPRFLNFGDRFELPFVVHNQTVAARTVDLAVRTANLDLVEGAGRRVEVPAGGRVEVRLPAAAARPGTARFTVAAVAGTATDAASGSLPVWTPATTEVAATYGHIDEGAVVQRVAAPADALPQFGGLEVTTSATAVAELTDAVLYLARYPYECNEQRASRMLTMLGLEPVLAAFKAPGLPEKAALRAFLAEDVAHLAAAQDMDGGWGFWGTGERTWPFVSVHVASALFTAKQRGLAVPEEVMEEAQTYLEDIEGRFGAEFGAAERRSVRAYALKVRMQAGDRDLAGARRLLGEVPLAQHSLETLGWLLPVLGDSPESAEVVRHALNSVRETAGAARFAADAGEGGYRWLWTARRTDAVMLDALIGAAPGSDAIARLARGLLAGRTRGRWGNTQENAFATLALARYFEKYERVRPDFVARAWLGERTAGESAFRGRTTAQRRVDVPMAALQASGPQDLVLAKEGPGRLYYRFGVRHALTSTKVAAEDRGFAVTRTYRGLDDDADVRRDPDGTWRIRAGARVRVEVTISANDRRYHVALVDPLPAGLEISNPALAGTRPQADDRDGWSRWWYDHDNLRDDRAEAFTTELWPGTYVYGYDARATTRGVFVVPPPKAEEMYAPETFGRGASDRVIVESRTSP